MSVPRSGVDFSASLLWLHQQGRDGISGMWVDRLHPIQPYQIYNTGRCRTDVIGGMMIQLSMGVTKARKRDPSVGLVS